MVYNQGVSIVHRAKTKRAGIHTRARTHTNTFADEHKHQHSTYGRRRTSIRHHSLVLCCVDDCVSTVLLLGWWNRLLCHWHCRLCWTVTIVVECRTHLLNAGPPPSYRRPIWIWSPDKWRNLLHVFNAKHFRNNCLAKASETGGKLR